MMMRILCFLFLTMFCAGAEERILSYDSEIRVGRDGYLDVVETIRVNVEGDEISRGIYRDFPQDYKTTWGMKQHRPFEVTEVKRNGMPEPYMVERIGSGTRVRIGSADVFLEEGSVQEYTIAYRTGRQLIFDGEGDELYWNVTGSYWNFPILEATAKVVLPEGISVTGAEAYTGPEGAQGRDYGKTEEADGVTFRTTALLGRNEGLTVVVRWEPGMLDAAAYEEPSAWEGNKVFFLGLGVVAAGLLVFVVNWFLVGRDPKRGLVVPGWEPPVGFSPAAVRYLKRMKFDNRCFTAAVLSLASKGFLKIKEVGTSGYKLVKREGEGLGGLMPDEESLYESLFNDGNSLLLKQTNHVQIGMAKGKLESALRSGVRGAFFHNHTGRWLPGLLLCACGLAVMTVQAEAPLAAIMMMVFATFAGVSAGALVGKLREGETSIAWGCLVVALLGAVGVILIVIAQFAGVWTALATVLLLVAAPVFHFLMKAPTKAGRYALDTIDGFLEYLEVAEEDRLNLENPPERTPELFERFLPYALALGVEQKWSEKFDGILSAAGEGEANYTPSFYTGGSSGLENALTGAGIASAIGGALASSSVAPGSSGSSSDGGGGGGGSSGGGGGGGGGGGW